MRYWIGKYHAKYLGIYEAPAFIYVISAVHIQL